MKTYKNRSILSILQPIIKKLKKNHNNQLNEIKIIWKQLQVQTAFAWLKEGIPKLIKDETLFIKTAGKKNAFNIKYKEKEIIKLFKQFSIKKTVIINN